MWRRGSSAVPSAIEQRQVCVFSSQESEPHASISGACNMDRSASNHSRAKKSSGNWLLQSQPTSERKGANRSADNRER